MEVSSSAVQQCCHCSGGKLHNARNLIVRFVLVVAESYGDRFVHWQLPDATLQPVIELTLDILFFRARIHAVGLLKKLGLFQGYESLSALPSVGEACVCGHPVDPGANLGLFPEPVKVIEDAEKHVLCQILGVLHVSQNPKCLAMNRLLVLIDYGTEPGICPFHPGGLGSESESIDYPSYYIRRKVR